MADLVGIQPHPSWQGINVLEPDYDSKDRPIFSMTQYTRWQEVVCINRFKYIYDLSEVQEYLFDLRTDPGEQKNVLRHHRDVADRLRTLLEKARGDLGDSRTDVVGKNVRPIGRAPK